MSINSIKWLANVQSPPKDLAIFWAYVVIICKLKFLIHFDPFLRPHFCMSSQKASHIRNDNLYPVNKNRDGLYLTKYFSA